MEEGAMKKLIIIITMVLAGLAAYGEQTYDLERGLLTNMVVNREPGLSNNKFKLYSKGYYYTEFLNIGEEKTIFHNWYYLGEGDEKTLTASVELKIAGFRWRTWSTKYLYLPGKWKVEVVDEEDNLITESSFTVE